MQEPRTITETLPPPPGVMGSLRAGFDVVAAHITAILLPLALDLLLWLGPRLRVDQLYVQFYNYWMRNAPALGATPDQIAQVKNSYTPELVAQLERLNVFALLRTLPIGISSLMAGARPAASPLGAPPAFQAGPFDLLLWIFILSFIGWMFGALYFRRVAELVVPDASIPMGRAVSQTLLYALIWSLLVLTFGLPALFIFSLLFTFNQIIGEGILLLLGVLSMWLIVPIFFSPHGMFVRKQNALASILGSFQITRFTMPTSSLFVMTVFLLGIGLNVLWAVPAADSWLALVGILGHAFVSTALLASSFVYYRDMTVWLQAALERMRAQMPKQQA